MENDRECAACGLTVSLLDMCEWPRSNESTLCYSCMDSKISHLESLLDTALDAADCMGQVSPEWCMIVRALLE